MPAPWTFAPWNDAIMGEETVMEVVYKLRDNGIPSSAIWSEDWAGGQWTELGGYLPVSYA